MRLIGSINDILADIDSRLKRIESERGELILSEASYKELQELIGNSIDIDKLVVILGSKISMMNKG